MAVTATLALRFPANANPPLQSALTASRLVFAVAQTDVDGVPARKPAKHGRHTTLQFVPTAHPCPKSGVQSTQRIVRLMDKTVFLSSGNTTIVRQHHPALGRCVPARSWPIGVQ